MERKIVDHPSFGVIEVSRISTSKGPVFFGSNMRPENYIELRLKYGELQRDLTDDKVFPANRKPIVKFRMTPVQFSDMIMNVGRGEGTACTLESIQGEQIEQLQNFQNRKEFVQRTFKQKMQEVGSRLEDNMPEIKRIIDKKNLSKDDQNYLKSLIESLSQEVKSNTPFYAQCFQETTDHLVQEAKAEIESAITHKIEVAGLSSLTGQLNLLGSKEESIENGPLLPFLESLLTDHNETIREVGAEDTVYLDVYLGNSNPGDSVKHISIPADFDTKEEKIVNLVDEFNNIVLTLNGVKSREDIKQLVKLIRG